DFSGVRIHADRNAAEMSSSIQAKAFTTGQDIFFNKGKYDPHSDSGKHLLAHELTHVVQQGGADIQRDDDEDGVPKEKQLRERDKKKKLYQSLSKALTGKEGLSAEGIDRDGYRILSHHFSNSAQISVGEAVPLYVAAHAPSAYVMARPLQAHKIIEVNAQGQQARFEVYIAPVGHGRCVIVVGTGGNAIAMDAGTLRPHHIAQMSVMFNNLIPSMGIRNLSEIYVSHLDADHVNLIRTLLNAAPGGDRTMIQTTLADYREIMNNNGARRTLSALFNIGEGRYRTADVSGGDNLVHRRNDRKGEVEITEYRVNPRAIENLPANSTNRITLNRNARSALTIVRHMKTGESVVFTADITGEALNLIINQVGRTTLVQEFGPNLRLAELPHHLGKVERGNDRRGVLEYISMVNTASGGKAETFSQTSAQFTGTGSSANPFYGQMGTDVHRIGQSTSRNMQEIESGIFVASESIIGETRTTPSAVRQIYGHRNELRSILRNLETEMKRANRNLPAHYMIQETAFEQEVRQSLQEAESLISRYEEQARRASARGMRMSEVTGNAETARAWGEMQSTQEQMQSLLNRTPSGSFRTTSNGMTHLRTLYNRMSNQIQELRTLKPTQQNRLVELIEQIEAHERTGQETVRGNSRLASTWGRMVSSLRSSLLRAVRANPGLGFTYEEARTVGEGLTDPLVESHRRAEENRGNRRSRRRRNRNGTGTAPPVRGARGAGILAVLLFAIEVYEGVDAGIEYFDQVAEENHREDLREQWAGYQYLAWWRGYGIEPNIVFLDKDGDQVGVTANLTFDQKQQLLNTGPDEFWKGKSEHAAAFKKDLWRLAVADVDEEAPVDVLERIVAEIHNLNSFLISFHIDFVQNPIGFDSEEQKWYYWRWEDGDDSAEYFNEATQKAFKDAYLLASHMAIWDAETVKSGATPTTTRLIPSRTTAVLISTPIICSSSGTTACSAKLTTIGMEIPGTKTMYPLPGFRCYGNHKCRPSISRMETKDGALSARPSNSSCA
ncbi:MAG: DUF4157 domain-containing protein, partial [Bacteroidota bacterium]